MRHGFVGRKIQLTRLEKPQLGRLFRRVFFFHSPPKQFTHGTEFSPIDNDTFCMQQQEKQMKIYLI